MKKSPVSEGLIDELYQLFSKDSAPSLFKLLLVRTERALTNSLCEAGFVLTPKTDKDTNTNRRLLTSSSHKHR